MTRIAPLQPPRREDVPQHVFAIAETEAEFVDALVVAAKLTQGRPLVVLSAQVHEPEIREWLRGAGIDLEVRLADPDDEAAWVHPERGENTVLVDFRGREDPGGWERRIQRRLTQAGAVGVCVYDSRELQRSDLAEAIACHGWILHNLQTLQNPYYVPALLESERTAARSVYQVWIGNIARWESAQKELMRRTQALEQSNQDLERFAYLASHDLQEPLRMIGGFAELLEHDLGPRADDAVKKYLDEIKQGVHRMRSLVRGLLALSTVSTRAVKPELVEAKGAAADAVANLRPLIQETNASISVGPLPLVRIDRAGLSQVFQNLVANALRFRSTMPPSVEISCRLAEQEWVFAVKDNGRGIPSDRRRDLFKPFRVRDPAGGSGLGLVITKRLVEGHGGRIWFEPNPDQGTTFFFTLPVLG